MYGSADLLVLFYLGLSRGIVSHIHLIILKCTAIHNTHLQVLVVFAHLGSIRIIT